MEAINAYAFDDNKNKVKIYANTYTVSEAIAAGASKDISPINLGTGNDLYTNPAEVRPFAIADYNVGDHPVAVQAGITSGTSGYAVTVRIDNLGQTQIPANNLKLHIILVGQ